MTSVRSPSARSVPPAAFARSGKDLVAPDQPAPPLDTASNWHRVQTVIRRDVVTGHHQRRDKTAFEARLNRRQDDRLLPAVGLRMLPANRRAPSLPSRALPSGSSIDTSSA